VVYLLYKNYTKKSKKIQRINVNFSRTILVLYLKNFLRKYYFCYCGFWTALWTFSISCAESKM